jgi:hypothetical protein
MWDGLAVENHAVNGTARKIGFRQLSVEDKLHLRHRKGTQKTPGDKVENLTLQDQDGNDPRPGV